MADYRIDLGIGLNTQDFSKIKNDIKSLEDKPIRLEIDAETKELTKSIQDALKTLSNGGQNTFTIDTSEFDKSIKGIKIAVEDLQKTFGSLGDNVDMKDLLTSVNQIAKAIGKVTDESEALAKSLSVLSKKDFGFNIGLDMGKKNNNMIAYGRAARKQVIPQLEAQIKELEGLFGGQQAAMSKLTAKGGQVGFDVFTDFADFNSDSAIKKMEAMEKYINSLKKLASIEHIPMGQFEDKFSKSATELIDDITGVETAVDKAEDTMQKFKNIFGSGIDADQLSAQLEPIVSDLNQIREAVQNLSKGVSLDGLTSSFDRLSGAIENLLTNAEKVKGILNSGFDVNDVGSTSTSTPSSTSAITSAQQTGKKIGETVTKAAQQSLNLDDVIDKEVTELMQKYSIAGEKGSDAFNKIKQAVVECRAELNTIKNGDFDIDEQTFGNSAAIDKVTNALSEQMRVANETSQTYGKLADYIKGYNTGGYKIHLPDSVKQEYGDDYVRMARTLGSAFTTGKGQDFESFIEDLNKELGETIDLSHGAEAAFKQLHDEVVYDRQQAKSQNKKKETLLAEDDLIDRNYLNRDEVYDDVMSIVNIVDTAEQKIAQSSAEMANDVTQSGEKIEQSYREIADAYEKISKGTSLTRDATPGDDFKKTFEASSQAAQEAQKHFQELLADEKAVVSVTEQFGNDNALQSFVVNIQRATGEVETLRYAMDKLDDGEDFIYQGGSTSDSKVEKQLETRIKKANELQIKLDKIKTGYDDMGATKPIKDTGHIEALDNQYEKVKKAIIDVRNADNSTFSSMVSNAERERAALENMVREYRNAESVATSLRSKDIDTVKATYASKLDNLILTMKDAGVYTSGFEKGAENLRSSLSSATDKSGLVSFLNGLDKLDAGYKRVAKSAKSLTQATLYRQNASGIEAEIKGWQRINPEINQFEAEIDGAKVSVQSLLKELGQVKTKSDFQVAQGNFRNFKKAAEAAGISLKETAQKLKSIDDIKIKIDDTGFNGFKQEVKRAHAAAEELEGVYPDLENALRRLDAAMEGVYSADQAGDVKRLVAANEEYESSLKQVYSQLELNQQAKQKAYKNELLSQKKAALSSEMEIWLKENTRAAKDFGEEIRRLQASLDGLDDKGVELVGQQFKNVTKQAQALGKTGLTTFDKLKAKAKEYMTYLSAAEIFMLIEQGLRDMFEQVKLIDSAMTELKKVTDETDAAYNEFLTNAANRAKEIGTTIDGLVESTADFARLGYDFADAQGLAEVANIYAVVGDDIESVEGATESLISTMAAFKDEMSGMSNTDFAMSIIDVYNEIGNNFAISSGGLGEALERSASSLAAGNNTLHESAALITAANEVVQNPEKVGNAMKTVSMRIRSAKSEMEEMGEDTEGMVESTASLRAEIMALSGVDIMASATEFKSTYQILDELSKKWADLSDISQATIIEKIAGKHQGNVFSSLMENFDTARDALETSLNSSGSAMAEHEKWSQSLEAKFCLDA